MSITIIKGDDIETPTSGVVTVATSDTAVLSAASSDVITRDVFLTNEGLEDIWISLGSGAAVVGEGTGLKKDNFAHFFFRTKLELRAIADAGASDLGFQVIDKT